MKVKKDSKLSPQERDILQQAMEIKEVTALPGWSRIVMFLQGSINFPDPKDFPTREAIIIPYTEAFGSANMVKKLGDFVNSQESVIKSLTEKEEEDVKSYAIGE
jgi:hypothetical protein